MREQKSKCQVCEKEFSPDELTMINTKKLCSSCMNLIWNIESKKMQIDKQKQSNIMNNQLELLRPLEIKRKLDEYIIGQETAKKTLSVAVYNHYKRLMLNDPDIQKSNLLFIGPTGSGKTHLIKSLARILNVPLAITPATSLTEEGYIGDSVDSVIEKLYISAGKDVALTERGIVFIDEVDKLSNPNSAKQREVGSIGVQQALLTLLEGTSITIGSKYGMFRDIVEINTTNILFICGGAFPQLDDIARERRINQSKQNSNANDNQYIPSNNQIMTEDLLKFGMIPELLGRLPVITKFEMLDIATLKRILTIPKDSIVSQYQKLFQYDKIKLSFEDEALEIIASKAYSIGTGARSLRSIIEDLLLDIMYLAPSDLNCREVIITRSFAEGLGMPMYITK